MNLENILALDIRGPDDVKKVSQLISDRRTSSISHLKRYKLFLFIDFTVLFFLYPLCLFFADFMSKKMNLGSFGLILFALLRHFRVYLLIKSVMGSYHDLELKLMELKLNNDPKTFSSLDKT